jgi:hypothetical protein
MLGAEGVSTAIKDKAEAAMPAKLAQLRARYSADEWTIPAPASLYSTNKDILSIEQFPSIIVTTVDTTGRIGNRQLGGDGVRDVYQYKYRMRIFVYVTGRDDEATDLLRQRYVLAAREVLLTNKILVDAGGQYAALDPNTVKESYSDVAADEAQMLLAGAYLEFEVTTSESLAAYPVPFPGEAEVIPSVDVLPHGITIDRLP